MTENTIITAQDGAVIRRSGGALIYPAMIAVMNEVQGVAKRDRNTQQNFSFRGIDAVLNAVGPALRKHNVFIRSEVLEKQTDEITTKAGGKMLHVVLLVAYFFVATDGTEVMTVVPGEASDAGDKGFSKAMSVALRTALIQALALPTDEPDPDHTTFERAEPVSDRDALRAQFLVLTAALGYNATEYGAKWKEASGGDVALANSIEGLREVIEELKAEQVVRATTGAVRVTPGLETEADLATAQDQAAKS